MYISLAVSLSTYLYLAIYIYIYQPIYLSLYLAIYLSIYHHPPTHSWKKKSYTQILLLCQSIKLSDESPLREIPVDCTSDVYFSCMQYLEQRLLIHDAAAKEGQEAWSYIPRPKHVIFPLRASITTGRLYAVWEGNGWWLRRRGRSGDRVDVRNDALLTASPHTTSFTPHLM